MDIFNYLFTIFNEFLEDIYPQLKSDYYTTLDTDV